MNQRLAVRILEKWGHIPSPSPATAVKPSRPGNQETFDLILMDVQMPEMSGLRSHRRHPGAREKALGRHIRIIAMTAHAMEGDREKCLSAGMDHYVTKPIDQKKLFDAIEIPRRKPDRTRTNCQLCLTTTI